MPPIVDTLLSRTTMGALGGLKYLRLRDASVLLAGFILLVPTVIPASANAAVASDPKHIQDEANVSDAERAQVPLVEAADLLQEVLTRREPSGFAGVAVDIKGQSVTLYWKGDLPAIASDLISTLRSSVALEVITVPYSQEELLEESRRIAENNLTAVTEVGPTPDFKGLRVVINQPFNTSQVRASITGGTRVPLSFTVGRPAEFAVDRWDDIDPFWAVTLLPVGAGSAPRRSRPAPMQPARMR